MRGERSKGLAPTLTLSLFRSEGDRLFARLCDLALAQSPASVSPALSPSACLVGFATTASASLASARINFHATTAFERDSQIECASSGSRSGLSPWQFRYCSSSQPTSGIRRARSTRDATSARAHPAIKLRPARRHCAAGTLKGQRPFFSDCRSLRRRRQSRVALDVRFNFFQANALRIICPR